MGAVVVLALVAGAYGAWLDRDVRARFDGQRWAVPAQIYARALELRVGARLAREDVERELLAVGYQAVDRIVRPGSFRRTASGLRVGTRDFGFGGGGER